MKHVKEIRVLKKENSLLKRKLIQITKYSRSKLTKVRKQLDQTREAMSREVAMKFQEYFNVLQGFMITVSEVKYFCFFLDVDFG
jgi:hypothetical protein